jgi:hypothetical protein
MFFALNISIFRTGCMHSTENKKALHKWGNGHATKKDINKRNQHTPTSKNYMKHIQAAEDNAN